MSAALLAATGLLLAGCSSTSTPAASTPAAVAPPTTAAAVTSSAAIQPASSAAVPSAPPSSAVPLSTAAPVSSVAVVTAPASTSAAAPAGAVKTDLKTAKTSLGTVVVTAKGLTVYYFTPDVANSGKSACSGGCATAWPPVVPTSGTATASDVTGKLGVITRADGSKQVTVDGRPLYTFDKDLAPGDVKGQKVKDAWYVVSPDGKQIGG